MKFYTYKFTKATPFLLKPDISGFLLIPNLLINNLFVQYLRRYILYEDDKRDYSERIVGRNEVRERVFSYYVSTKQIVTILQYKNKDA